MELRLQVKADSLTKTPIHWKLPEQVGQLLVTARTTAVTATPSAHLAGPARCSASDSSERSASREIPKEAMNRTFVLLGADDAIKACSLP